MASMIDVGQDYAHNPEHRGYHVVYREQEVTALTSALGDGPTHTGALRIADIGQVTDTFNALQAQIQQQAATQGVATIDYDRLTTDGNLNRRGPGRG